MYCYHLGFYMSLKHFSNHRIKLKRRGVHTNPTRSQNIRFSMRYASLMFSKQLYTISTESPKTEHWSTLCFGCVCIFSKVFFFCVKHIYFVYCCGPHKLVLIVVATDLKLIKTASYALKKNKMRNRFLGAVTLP